MFLCQINYFLLLFSPFIHSCLTAALLTGCLSASWVGLILWPLWLTDFQLLPFKTLQRNVNSFSFPVSQSLRRTRSDCLETGCDTLKGKRGQIVITKKSGEGNEMNESAWREEVTTEVSLSVWTVPLHHRPDVPCSKGTTCGLTEHSEQHVLNSHYKRLVLRWHRPAAQTQTTHMIRCWLVESFCLCWCVWFADVLKHIWAAGRALMMSVPMITYSQRSFDLVLSHLKSLLLFLFCLSGSEVLWTPQRGVVQSEAHVMWWEGDRCMQVD